MCSDRGDWTCLQPGFPIRKSSDHSLVIDSPRLIADSYVLLRFLVPRHPPCALINLSHKDLRCSRPLCSSQHTGGPLTVGQRLPMTCIGGSSAVGSWPVNGLRSSNARALRTQQRVRRRLLWMSFPSSEEVYWLRPSDAAPNNRCSTLERLLTDIRGQTRLWIACATSAP